ncbi:uncharacterized protein LOC135387274 [Ornithodoros turicata]|uniref:uncharacterized protein LOC135387274 n=1 Tax=Ornithodoros turicata TaxID=34597 RepID=UPI003139D975
MDWKSVHVEKKVIVCSPSGSDTGNIVRNKVGDDYVSQQNLYTGCGQCYLAKPLYMPGNACFLQTVGSPQVPSCCEYVYTLLCGDKKFINYNPKKCDKFYKSPTETC